MPFCQSLRWAKSCRLKKTPGSLACGPFLRGSSSSIFVEGVLTHPARTMTPRVLLPCDSSDLVGVPANTLDRYGKKADLRLRNLEVFCWSTSELRANYSTPTSGRWSSPPRTDVASQIAARTPVGTMTPNWSCVARRQWANRSLAIDLVMTPSGRNMSTLIRQVLQETTE